MSVRARMLIQSLENLVAGIQAQSSNRYSSDLSLLRKDLEVKIDEAMAQKTTEVNARNSQPFQVDFD